MLSWAVTFLIVGLIAAVLGFSGIAGTAVNIGWILAVIGIVLFLVFMVVGRPPPLSATSFLTAWPTAPVPGAAASCAGLRLRLEPRRHRRGSAFSSSR